MAIKDWTATDYEICDNNPPDMIWLYCKQAGKTASSCPIYYCHEEDPENRVVVITSAREEITNDGRLGSRLVTNLIRVEEFLTFSDKVREKAGL